MAPTWAVPGLLILIFPNTVFLGSYVYKHRKTCIIRKNLDRVLQCHLTVCELVVSKNAFRN